jgi:hypothetical protein
MNDSRITGFFKPHRQFSDILPAIYLDSKVRSDNPHHVEVFFVNATEKILDFVASPEPLLFLSSLTGSNVKDDVLYYEDIASGEAVKVAEFDIGFDSDSHHHLTLIWQGPTGDAQSVTITGKGIETFTRRSLEWTDK